MQEEAQAGAATCGITPGVAVGGGGEEKGRRGGTPATITTMMPREMRILRTAVTIRLRARVHRSHFEPCICRSRQARVSPRDAVEFAVARHHLHLALLQPAHRNRMVSISPAA